MTSVLFFLFLITIHVFGTVRGVSYGDECPSDLEHLVATTSMGSAPSGVRLKRYWSSSGAVYRHARDGHAKHTFAFESKWLRVRDRHHQHPIIPHATTRRLTSSQAEPSKPSGATRGSEDTSLADPGGSATVASNRVATCRRSLMRTGEVTQPLCGQCRVERF